MRDINERLMWLNGVILPVNQAKINVLAPTSQFGANVFEGIRCYWNEEQQQLYTFRLNEHYRRLLNSIKMFRMESSYTVEDFKQGLIDVVKANNYKEDIAVRQTVFVNGYGSWSSKGPVGMFIAPIPKGRMLNQSNTGLKCCISSWERISDRNMSPRVKVGANYINSRLAQLEAIENGYNSAIFMNNQGKIAEGPGSCLFIIRDGRLITPPLTASVLESITRDTLIHIAHDILHIEIVERDIDRTELYICDEAFLCGSAMEVTSVINIDGYEIGNGQYLITKKIHDMYLETVSGKIKGYNTWLTPIY